MKTSYKIITAAAVLSISLSSCVSKLDVSNPNRFTDEQMAAFMSGSPEAEEKVLTGLVRGLPGYINVYNADMNGGYSNVYACESSFEFRRFCQSGDVIEGDALNQGNYATWYQNLANNTYWRTDQEIQNYGYYLGPHKLHPAQKALDFLTDDKMEKYPSMKASRAQALTLKAICYLMLMERYTDLQDVTSTTAQGWPIYNKFDYNAAQAPLSVAETWNWINSTLKEAADLFKGSTYGTEGYTIGNESAKIYDIDCAVTQYYRCRAAMDSKEWETVIEAGTDLLNHYPGFIGADAYGMDAALLPSVNSSANVSDKLPQGTGWNGTDFNAASNAFFNLEKDPEAIFGGARGSSSIFWAWDGLNALKRGPAGYYQINSIYDALSDDDCRKACILPEAFDGFHIYTNEGTDTTWFQYTMPKYTSLKWAASSAIDYKNHSNEATKSDNIYLRSSAVLLMVAEAYAQSGQDSQAKSLLDKLLSARTIDSASKKMTCDGTMSGKKALDMVKLQWRIEMWGEGDWAFFNQKRWGAQNSRGSNHWSSTQIPTEGFTWEIPQKERQGNPYWD